MIPPTINVPVRLDLEGVVGQLGILNEIVAERDRQDDKFGDQSHRRDRSVGPEENWEAIEHIDSANAIRDLVDKYEGGSGLGYDLILLEEVAEALEEFSPRKLRTELVQVAAVAVAWIEAIDKRERAMQELVEISEDLGLYDDAYPRNHR